MLAEQLALPITVKTLAPNIAQRSLGLGLEEIARRERHLALAEAGLASGTRLIALAHHQRDQAESVLLHLSRGAGLAGAAGIAELADVEIPWWTGSPIGAFRVWRPLISEPRELLEAVVASLGLPPIVDPSNDDPRFLRNWLRTELVPALEARVPGATANVSRFAEIAREDDRFLRELATNRLHGAMTNDGLLAWSAIRDDPRPIARRVIRRWLENVAPAADVTLDRVDAIADFARRARSDGMLEIGSGVVVVWRQRDLLVGPLASVIDHLRGSFTGPLAEPEQPATRLQSGVPALIDGWAIAAFGPGSIIWRTVRDGDRFAGSALRLHEHARAHGIHPLLRRRLLTAVGEAGPVWIAGLPIPHGAIDGGWRFTLTKLEDVS